MTLWLVRAGRYGEGEAVALRENCVVAGWDDMPDLSGLGGWDDVKSKVLETYPDAKAMTQSLWTGQLISFRDNIRIGDLVILPLKGQPFIAVGEVTGEYFHHKSGPDGAFHRRGVRWLDTALPKVRIDQDIIYSLGSLLTVSRPKPPQAEERIRALLAKGPKLPIETEDVEAERFVPQDVQDLARDQIANLILARFKGHGLAQLVSDLLRAEGFSTKTSPPGADGGVDILAGKGGLGLESPRIVVQVKSSNEPTDAPTVRQLQGVVARFGADYGLFVSWGGYKPTVDRETAHDHFRIRLWTAKEVIDGVLEHYDRLSPETRTLLPLRRIWALAPDED